MTDIDRLIDAVEAGTFLMDVLPQHEATAYEAFSGSLDAAKRLHDALLPGWDWLRWPQGDFEVKHKQTRQHFGGDNADPARAWLLAILKAYRSTL